jgi:hypothetical protein
METTEQDMEVDKNSNQMQDQSESTNKVTENEKNGKKVSHMSDSSSS